MTARPRRPESIRRPPSGANGWSAGRSTSVSRDDFGPSSQTTVGVAVEPRLAGVPPQAAARDRQDVVVEVAVLEQRVHQERRTAGGDEVVDVRRAVGVDPRQQRHGGRQVGQVVPRERDARGRGDRDEVHGVVGRAAGREQGDAGVDDRLLVDQVPDRGGLTAGVGDRDGARAGRPVERRAQRGVGVGERRVGQVQAHDLHQHLVAVGGAVERARALRVVRRRLGLEQLLAPDLALGVELAHARLLAVRAARTSSGRPARRRWAGGRTTARR